MQINRFLKSSACLRSVSVFALAAGLPSAAFAQSAEGDIVVTGSYTTDDKLGSATGLPLSLQETPQSVTVMTAQRLEDQGIRTLSDVINNAAGVSSRALDNARNGFSARGFDIDNYQIDGIPVQYETAYSAGETLLDVALYERVEIVRGATGMMSGAGNPSASVNLIRKHADARELTGSVMATASRWDNYSVMADVGAPVTSDGTIRVRGVAKYEEGDSFTDLLHNKKLVLYGVVDADLTPDTHVSAGISYQDIDPRGTQWGGLPVWFSDGTRTDWSRSKTIGADWTSWKSTNQTMFARLQQDIGNDWQVTVYGNRTLNKSDMRLLYLSGTVDKDTGEGLGAMAANYKGRAAQNDVGIRVTGKYQMFGREHDLIAGASYASQEFAFYSRAAGATAQPGNFFEWDGSFPEPSWGASSQVVDTRTKQWGYYAATRLSLADPLKVIVGGRLASWERSGVSYGASADYGDKNRFLPYAGVLFDLTSNHTIYASYTKIFTPQNFQDQNANYLPPVTGANYEGGLKSTFFGGKLNTAISIFRIEQDNLGQQIPDQYVNGDPTLGLAYRAAKGAHSTGFEIEANGEILPGWQIATNYTQFKAKDASGVRVNSLYPQKLLRLFTTYGFRGDLDGLTVGGGVNWEGLSYTDTTNAVTGDAERLKVKPYALVNLMTRYQLQNGLSAQINVENLFDKKYYSQIGFYNQLAYGEPRNVTLTLRYQF
ncbi:TonB-dependent siderophore receptor [Novosphingobium sp. TCA1]|uniref:TonB-dependent siderophore receptor n=1 Tax=Novosphingobium pentaromativorans TaxID=205844 RepID=A0A2W5Q7N8_9SPHN|nr:TonB-dependent siderophore receptor [Novosphingobium sp. TCA1]PZQ53427.1 MAG: TonB-dependent siderophore receptor [Novosphingobium pentaromativorans]GFE75446.1 TonB-dependent receptor [Novosphingobium sp. TCA1]